MSFIEFDRLHDLVARDVDTGLGAYFTPTDDGLGDLVGLEPDEEPMASSTRAALPWQFSARHDRQPFAGIPPTGREVVVRGVTIVEERDGEEHFHRFVDWLNLFEQLGAVLVSRPVVEAFPGDPEFRDRFGLLRSERADGSSAD